MPFFLGAGAYRHHVPASVDHLIQRGEFLTSYTPYQPEIAQGTLQVLFEFQTQVARLLGTDIANASMYDGSTACWEAIAMAGRVTRRKRHVLSAGLHPHYVETARTMARFTGDALVTATPAAGGCAGRRGADRPDRRNHRLASSCNIRTASAASRTWRGSARPRTRPGALLVVVVTEPVALGLLEAPGHLGADIVVGEGQSLGVGLQFGGPYLGLFGCAEKFVRQMPGRLCGETVDADGKRGFVLTLSTREQHIRREKATSNICTNSGLCALAFSIHMTLLGGEGLARLARINHGRAQALAARLAQVPGVRVLNDVYFNEFTVLLPGDARETVHRLAQRQVLGGVSLGRLWPGAPELANGLLVTATECTTAEDIEAFGAALEEVLA